MRRAIALPLSGLGRWFSALAIVTVGGLLAASQAGAASSAAPATRAPAGSPAGGIGVVSVVPATGTDQLPLTLVTSGVCPAGGTNVIGSLFGPELPASGLQSVPNSSEDIFPRTTGGGLSMPSNNTLRNLVNDLPDSPLLKGTYRVVVECRGPSKIADLGDFYGSLIFDGHHGYVATEPDVPSSSLATVAGPSGLPVPTAVGSQAPQAVASVTPVAVQAHDTPSGSTNPAPWVIGGGVAVVLAGLVTLLRGRRRVAHVEVRQ